MKAILINQYYISRVVIKIGWLIITHKYIFIFLIVCRFNFYACLSLLAGLLQFLFNHFLHSFNLFVYIFCIFDVFFIAENFFLIIIKFYQFCIVLVKIKSLSIKINLAARASWYFKLINGYLLSLISLNSNLFLLIKIYISQKFYFQFYFFYIVNSES